MRSKRRSLDPVATKAAILKAAGTQFATHGFSAASIQAIADQAGVPKGLVLYHFGSKEELWQQVLLQKISPLFQQAAAFLADDSAEAWDLVRTRFRLFQSDPELGRIFAWMSLEPSSPLDPERIAFIRQVGAKLRAVGDKKSLPEDVDPRELTLLQLTALDGYFRFRFIYTEILGLTPDSPELEERFLELLRRMTVKPMPITGKENG